MCSELDENVLTTLITMVILEVHYQPEKTCWEMFATKMRSFILKSGVTEEHIALTRKKVASYGPPVETDSCSDDSSDYTDDSEYTDDSTDDE